MEMMKWFERKFTFDLPKWMYPNVVERLRGTPARADLIVSGIGKEVLTRRDAERWSIQENLGHLLDLEPLWMGRIDDILQGKERLRDADLTNRKTYEAGHNSANLKDLQVPAESTEVALASSAMPQSTTQPFTNPTINVGKHPTPSLAKQQACD